MTASFDSLVEKYADTLAIAAGDNPVTDWERTDAGFTELARTVAEIYGHTSFGGFITDAADLLSAAVLVDDEHARAMLLKKADAALYEFKDEFDMAC